MANSLVVSTIKNKVMSVLANDENIFNAINSPTIKDFDLSDELINTHIFPYNQNPEVVKNSITFITVQVQIPRTHDMNKTFVKAVLEIFILSHNDRMKVDNIPKITANRNDYLSQLIDDRFNGKDDFGIGQLKLESNVEGSFSPEYLYRRMTFEIIDLNTADCDEG